MNHSRASRIQSSATPGNEAPRDQVPGDQVIGDQVTGDQAPRNEAPSAQSPAGNPPDDLGIFPLDEANRTLLGHVHPANWVNPQPEPIYNMVVIGAGTGGLITAAIAAGLGAKVALIERRLMGGDCLNTGCVPSKALIRSARRAAESKAGNMTASRHLSSGELPQDSDGASSTVTLANPPKNPPSDDDFAAAMKRLRAIRARISEDDSALRYRDDLGIDVFIGEAAFAGGDTIEVHATRARRADADVDADADADAASTRARDALALPTADETETVAADKAGKVACEKVASEKATGSSPAIRLRFKKAVIATGARALHPDIKGLAKAGYLTNESVFNLTERPGRLLIIGAGPIGCEMAQSFQRLGSQVILLDLGEHVLSREDPDAAAIIQEKFTSEGIELAMGALLEKVSMTPTGEKVVHYTCQGSKRTVVVDEILVGAGRVPNVEGLGLEKVGVNYYGRRGVHVNDHLRTDNPRIYAVGDCAMSWKFTHAADAAAKIVVQNALFFGRKKLSDLTMPWVTYTDPEVAHVGMYEGDAEAAGLAIDTYKVPLEKVNRAVCDGETEGFIKIHTKQGSDTIVGATIVASHAGEMLSEITLAIVGKLGLSTIASVIHPYPTQAEGIKAAANLYMRTKLTAFAQKALGSWLSLSRR